MNIKFSTIFALLFFYFSAQAQLTFNSASIFSITATTTTVTPVGDVRHAAYDPSGNIYMAGIFSNTFDADPNATVFPLTTLGVTDTRMYIIKLDPNGNLLWAHVIGGTSTTEYLLSIYADESGVYIAGRLVGSTIDLDPGPGLGYNSPNGSGFFAKYDANGNFKFAKSIDEVSFNAFTSCDKIVVDSAKNIYIAGNCSASSSGPATFDVNPSTSANTIFTVTTGHTNIFYSKYDSLGNFIWGKQIIGNYSLPQDLQLDKQGNIYLSGTYGSSGNDFDPGPLAVIYTSANSTQSGMFFAKYNNMGDYIFAKDIRLTGMANAGSSSSVQSIRIGVNKDIYLGGYFKGSPDFNPSSVSANNVIITATGGAGGLFDAFLAKYDSLGNYQWVRTFGNSNNDFLNSMDIDANDNLYYTGSFQGAVDFDPSSTNINTINSSIRVGYLGFLDSTGTFVFAEKFSDSTCNGSGVSIKGNTLYLTGTGTDTLNLDFDTTASNNIVLTANRNVFLSRYQIGNVPLGIELLSFTGSNTEQGHYLQWSTISESNNAYFNIEHSTNGITFAKLGRVNSKAINGNSIGNLNYSYLNKNPLLGDNFYRLQRVDFNGSFSHSKIVSIHNSSINEISIYPNPVSNQLFINSNKRNLNYQIENSLGQIIEKGKVPTDMRLYLQNYKVGIYLIRINESVFKFVKE